MASLNPFSSPSATSPGDESGWLNGPKSVGSSIAGGAKSAATTSRDTVAGWFGSDEASQSDATEGDATDPTSLAHSAEVTPEILIAYGRLWESKGDFAKAMESYARVLEKQPNHPETLTSIAQLHLRQNNPTKAAEYFSKAIKEKPDDAALYDQLGMTLNKLGNHSAAVTTIEQALRLAPGTSRYANNLATVKFEVGDTTGALEVLVKNNKPAVAHYNMAFLHFKRGQFAESTRHLNQALVYQPQAFSDIATKRAIQRSRELLAQIGPIPGVTVPGSNNSVPNTIATNTQPSATPPYTAPMAPTAVRQAIQSLPPNTNGAQTQGTIRPVSTSSGKTNVNFGNASYKTPAPSNATPPATFSLPSNFQVPQ